MLLRVLAPPHFESNYSDGEKSSSIAAVASAYVPGHDFNASIVAFAHHIECIKVFDPESSRRTSFWSAETQSWLSHRIGSSVTLEDIAQGAFPMVRLHDKQSESARCKPPDRALMQECIEVFSQGGMHSIFPFVDIAAIRNLLSNDQSSAQGTQVADLAALCAFTSFVCRLRSIDLSFADSNPDSYIKEALNLLPLLLAEETTPRALETLVLLCFCVAVSGYPLSVEMLLAMAARMVYRLEGHRRTTTRARGVLKSEHVRALFWACYSLDREFSLRHSRPPLIQDEDCDLDLPCTPSGAPPDLRLALIKSKIYRLLYSRSAKAKCNSERLRHVRELDEELSALKATWAAEYHCPIELANLSGQWDAYEYMSARNMIVNLDYYHCMAKIHEASLNCSMLSSTNRPLLSSITLFYQASRSTLVYVRLCRRFLRPRSFWMYAHPLLTAVLSLFWSLVQDPLASSFDEDMKILEDVRQIFASDYSVEESTVNFSFQITQAFITRLICLARGASYRATLC